MTERVSKGLIWKATAKRLFGFEYAPITNYMQRWVLYLGWFNLRVHRFLRGDDDRAPHDHPFWFITIPTKMYYETVMNEDGSEFVRKVTAWRPHFRPAKFRHIVHGTNFYDTEPFFTFVIAGARENGWGFWPSKDKFIPWKEWK